MIDIYNDESFNPNFTITSAPPSQMAVSPSNEVFAQRLQATDGQHLSVVHSPVSAPLRNGFPFQHGSARNTSTETPQTISPKDALLDYHAPEGEGDFPLFPQQGPTSFDSNHIKDLSQPPHSFASLRLDAASFGNFVPLQLPSNIEVAQHYHLTSQPNQQNGHTPMSNSSATPSRVGSEDSLDSDSLYTDNTVKRPSATGTGCGTYTCTYHGCTLRFETPALLQKHKQEGHRQGQGLGGPRRPDSAGDGMTSNLLSQAGPHRCDRINPSTGKPCGTIFSRPYDFTRHEDTIHNIRKPKARCKLCTHERTFSRIDALTRHYRMCHPEVEFPDRHRRRGGH